MDEIRIDTVAEGRPAEPREEREDAVYDLLDGLGIPYLRADHPAAFTMEQCAAVERALGAPVAKNLFLCDRQKTRFFLLLMPGGKPFKTKYLAGQFEGPRLSFADEAALGELLRLTPGSVCPFGLLFDPDKRVKLLVDRELLDAEYVCFHPCRNTSTLRLRTEDFRARLLPALGHEPAWVTLPDQLPEQA